MNKFIKLLAVAFFSTALLVCIGCTQLPTENRNISDMRPQISFKIANEGTKTASVLVDGLAMGSVGNYLDGAAALRIFPGTHVLTIVLGNQIILEEKFYAGDGVSRSFVLN